MHTATWELIGAQRPHDIVNPNSFNNAKMFREARQKNTHLENLMFAMVSILGLRRELNEFPKILKLSSDVRVHSAL